MHSTSRMHTMHTGLRTETALPTAPYSLPPPRWSICSFLCSGSRRSLSLFSPPLCVSLPSLTHRHYAMPIFFISSAMYFIMSCCATFRPSEA